MKVYRTSASSKYCATCEYWGAMRQVRLSTVESDEWGICSNRRSSFYGKEIKYKDRCSKYMRWIVLER
jgi:hypothetical protein